MPADNTPAIEAEREDDLRAGLLGAVAKINEWMAGNCAGDPPRVDIALVRTFAETCATTNRVQLLGAAPPAQAPEAVVLTDEQERRVEREIERHLRAVSKQGPEAPASHLYIRLCEAMGYEEGPRGLSPEEFAAELAARSSAPGSAVEVETKESGDADQA